VEFFRRAVYIIENFLKGGVSGFRPHSWGSCTLGERRLELSTSSVFVMSWRGRVEKRGMSEKQIGFSVSWKEAG